MNAVFEVGQSLVEEDFRASGRTLDNLGLRGKSLSEIVRFVQ
jgi:hypothetical protein